MKRITIPYFPTGLRYASILLLTTGIYLALSGHYIWTGILVLTVTIIVTTKYVTEINLPGKQYCDYLFFLGMHLNKDRKRFSFVDKIVITKGKHAQTINTRVQSRQLNWSYYTGTLLLDNNDFLDLFTSTDKHELLLKLKEFATYLNVHIEDHSMPQAYTIDMNSIQP